MNECFRHGIWSLACGLLLVLGFAFDPPRTLADDPLKLLLLTSPDTELTARVRGQTRDLAIALEVAEPPRLLSGESAAQIARQHGADVVVWAEADGPSQLTLHILTLESGALHRRVLSTPTREALASSTTAEMGALVVRSELSALLDERKTRRTESEPTVDANALEDAPEAARHARTSPRTDAQPAPARPTNAGGPWRLALGYRLDRPLKGTLAHGFVLGARRDVAGFALGLAGSVDLPVHLTRADTSISIERVQLRLEALKFWSLAATLRLLVGVSGHVGLDLRRTGHVGEGLDATRATASWTGGLGLLGEVQWRFAGFVGGFLSCGAEGVPWRTEFVVQSDHGRLRLGTLSWLNPWLSVGLFTRF